MATYAAYRHIELDNIGYGKKRVLKPPGGGSSDIFGAGAEETSPRRMKNHNQSQLGSSIFGENNIGNGSDTPRGNKPGNDSYNRLFGPPEVPTTPNSKNHMRSNISLSGKSLDDSSPTKSSASSSSNVNGNRNASVNGNSEHSVDNSAFRRNKRFRGSSCMPRNPVTGDGVDVTPLRRSARKCRDGNPVTGTGYTGDAQNNIAPVQNGNANSTDKTNGTTPASAVAPAPAAAGQARPRVPPGGFSSGLW